MLNISIDQIKYLITSCLFVTLLAACSDFEKTPDASQATAPVATQAETAKAGEVGELAYKPFTDQQYNFSTEIPEEWVEASNQIAEGLPVINFVSQEQAGSTQLPISMQTASSLSHIDVHPKGHDSGFPIGKSHRLKVYEGEVPAHNMWDRDRSRVYVLGNGEVWAYLLYPKSAPRGWDKDGFIFAQIAIDNFSSECFDDITNQRKNMDACKPLEGDEVLYYGRVNAEDQQYIIHALQSLELKA